MSKRFIMILVAMFVVGIAVSAYAEVQNVKLGGDIQVQAVARNSFQTDDTAEHERGIIGAARVQVDADLTDNVSATMRLLSERLWGDEDDNTTNVDMDLAYITLRELAGYPITLVVGRQELRYGNALIIGDYDGNGIAATATPLPTTLTDLSLRKSFDAIKMILDYDPLVIDIVHAQIEENTTTRADDVKLSGVNANYRVNNDFTAEAYIWSRDREVGSTGLTDDWNQGERLNVTGVRGVFTGIKNLTLGLEGAYQFGDHVDNNTLYPNDSVRTAGEKYRHQAYGYQITSLYMMPDVKYTPMINMSYTELSGDKDLNNNRHYKGWDAMFEDQAGGTIFNKILGFSNCRLFNLGGSLRPMDDVTVKLDWYNLRMIQPFNQASGGDGTVTRILSGVASDANTTCRIGKRHLADELDLVITYDYTEDVQFVLNSGVFFPGEVFDKLNRKRASQVIGSMKVTF
ncbi:MAG: hypothetical protein DRP74_05630 [Candidatus Omnitrophota bacterium]|nr:MAG: hypothetical protein DRP74_05630 [Candidatus Omnitrophota bacterium]